RVPSRPPLPCRASPPQGGRLAAITAFANCPRCRVERGAETAVRQDRGGRRRALTLQDGCLDFIITTLPASMIFSRRPPPRPICPAPAPRRGSGCRCRARSWCRWSPSPSP
ncbi:MAG: hypothetical protein E5V60_33915, partial [Mesorhizobium sp.]